MFDRVKDVFVPVSLQVPYGSVSVSRRLRDRKKAVTYTTIAEVYAHGGATGFCVWDMNGRKLGPATDEQARAAIAESGRGNVKEVSLAHLGVFGELAVVTIDGKERLVG